MSNDFKKIWQARKEALEYLDDAAVTKAETIADLFGIVDGCIEALESVSEQSHAAEIYGLTVLKAKNLAVGALSLILDGLGQEAGALMRPMIEYTELLIYLRQNPAAISDIRAGRNLPSAGKRAQQIAGKFKGFREHLNRHASHGAYSYYSLSHLRDPTTKRWKLLQTHVPQVLERNLGDLAAQIYVMLREALWCVHEQCGEAFTDLGARYDELKPTLFDVFSLDDRKTERSPDQRT